MAATDTQITDAARDAMLDTLETGEVYEIDGIRVERDLGRLNDIRKEFERNASTRRPAITLLRRRRA